MPEWWSYSLADFVMFSPAVYERLFELENARLWPYQCVALLAGVVMLVLLLGGRERRQRVAQHIAALAWLVCAWVYFHRSYASIHTYANGFAVLFAAQGVLLLLDALVGKRATSDARDRTAGLGVAIVGLAVLVQPLLFLLGGRAQMQTELFACMPDPTVLATIGVLAARRTARGWLFVVPLLWSIYSALTLYTMLPYPLIAIAAGMAAAQAVLALLLSIQRLRPRRRGAHHA